MQSNANCPQKKTGPLPKLLHIMKVSALLLVIVLQIASRQEASAQVSLKEKSASLEKVLKVIKKQSDYGLSFDEILVRKKGKPVDVTVENVSVETALTQVFKTQDFLTYAINGKIISIKEKQNKSQNNAIQLSNNGEDSPSAIEVHGYVKDEGNKPLAGVSIWVKGTNKGTTTNENGEFVISGVDPKAILIISAVNIQTLEVAVKGLKEIIIGTKTKISELDEVSISVSTGYQIIQKEKVTGSISKLSNEQINRRVSTTILDRIDGITPGLSFNKNLSASGQKLGITIHGASTIGTIDGKVNTDPLIILDNFPYEGDIAAINPNDIESITVLKDAGAASIWGARAGNGVIILTTKKGRRGQPMRVEFNTAITTINRPNLYYSPNFLSSSDYISIEQFQFSKGFYDATLNNTTTFPAVSPVVELLNQQRKGLITQAQLDQQLASLSQQDIRQDLSSYFYRPATLQQYAISLRGGSQNFSYIFSTGLDRNLESKVRNDLSRITVNTFATYTPLRNLELSFGMLYANSARDNNNSFNFTNSLPSYSRLADINGNPLIVKGTYRSYYSDSTRRLGWLDWNYRPLQDLRSANNTSNNRELIMRAGLNYKFRPWLEASLQYQREQQQGNTFNIQDTGLYFTRDLINKFTTLNGTIFNFGIPQASILDQTFNFLTASNYRGQLQVNKSFGNEHKLTAIVGGELREIISRSYGYRLYGYDDRYGTVVTNLNFGSQTPTSPRSSDRIPSGNTPITETTNRYVSAYSILGYSFKERYSLTLSGRRDGANIFGVRTNQQITPLWSVGAAWKISSEKWYNLNWLPLLNIRGTYGFNGNIYNASAYLTASYGTDFMTGAQSATITRPPNGDLRWERVQNINFGVDFKLKKDILSGSIDVFQKNGLDLIQSSPVPSSSGFTSFFSNSASIRTKGIDISVTSVNLNRSIRWTTTLLLNYNTDKVLRYDPVFTANKLVDYSQITAGLLPVTGQPLYGVYAYPSAGLDPQTGDPLGFQGKSISKNYSAIINTATIDSLEFIGSSKPTLFGSIMNQFSYHNFTLSINIGYKFGYWFKKPSTNINYQNALLSGGVKDYALRWQKPGDELNTTVPSIVYPDGTNDPVNRNNFYQGSTSVIEKGDHIRLQDISIGYTFSRDRFPHLPFAQIQIYGYANNLGLLYSATKSGLDPDYVTVFSLPQPRSFSIGFRANF